jgi:hypothetical protein
MSGTQTIEDGEGRRREEKRREGEEKELTQSSYI